MTHPVEMSTDELILGLEVQANLMERLCALLDESFAALDAGDLVGWRACQAEADLLRASGVKSTLVADEARRRLAEHRRR